MSSTVSGLVHVQPGPAMVKPGQTTLVQNGADKFPLKLEVLNETILGTTVVDNPSVRPYFLGGGHWRVGIDLHSHPYHRIYQPIPLSQQ